MEHMTDKNNKRLVILVIGGAGFVGSNLCAALAAGGQYEVFSLDNYSSGMVENHIQGVQYIFGDARDILKLDIKAPDVVFHLGEYSRVENSLSCIDEVLDNNIVGTQRVLKFCKLNGCKLIYAGSSTKFGDNGSTIFETPYAFSKSYNADMVRAYCGWSNLDFCISYFYNVYGPGENSTGQFATLIGIFERQYANSEKLTVVAPGTQTRNFTHISDIVSGLLLLIDAPSGDDYGIGAKETYSIIEVAEMFGCGFEILPERIGNRFSATLKTEKISSLGWKQRHNLRDYIRNITG